MFGAGVDVGAITVALIRGDGAADAEGAGLRHEERVGRLGGLLGHLLGRGLLGGRGGLGLRGLRQRQRIGRAARGRQDQQKIALPQPRSLQIGQREHRRKVGQRDADAQGPANAGRAHALEQLRQRQHFAGGAAYAQGKYVPVGEANVSVLDFGMVDFTQLQLAEALGEADVLAAADVLITQEQHLVLEQQAATHLARHTLMQRAGLATARLALALVLISTLLIGVLAGMAHHLGQVAAAFFGQRGHGHADQVALAGGIQAQVALADGLLDLGAHALFPGLHADGARIQQRHVGHLAQRHHRTVIFHMHGVQQGWIGTTGADFLQVVLEGHDGLVHLAFHVFLDIGSHVVSSGVGLQRPAATHHQA